MNPKENRAKVIANKNNGTTMSDKELLEYGLDHLSESCCFFFEINSDEGKALAFMADCALKYAQAIYNERDPLLSEEFYDSQREQRESTSK